MIKITHRRHRFGEIHLCPPNEIYWLILSVMLAITGLSFAQTSGPNQNAVTKTEERSFSSIKVSKVDPQEYLISPDDVLDVYVVDVPELTRTYRVSPTGQLSLPLLPRPLDIAGLTLNQFSDLTMQELKSQGLVSDPRVTVTVKESRLHSVAITGAVKKPQIYFVLGRTSLLDVLSQAEGLASDASSTANITRGEIAKRVLGRAEPAPEIFTVDLEKLLNTGDPALNVDIYPGDRVTVAPAGVVYVVGAVNKPGGFALTADRQHLTVLQAIALAEDVKSSAVKNNTMIIRRGLQYPDGRKEIPIKLKEILVGKAEDIPLQTNDILFIPEGAGKKAILRGVEAAIQVATGLVIYRR